MNFRDGNSLNYCASMVYKLIGGVKRSAIPLLSLPSQPYHYFIPFFFQHAANRRVPIFYCRNLM